MRWRSRILSSSGVNGRIAIHRSRMALCFAWTSSQSNVLAVRFPARIRYTELFIVSALRVTSSSASSTRKAFCNPPCTGIRSGIRVTVKTGGRDITTHVTCWRIHFLEWFSGVMSCILAFRDMIQELKPNTEDTRFDAKILELCRTSTQRRSKSMNIHGAGNIIPPSQTSNRQ